MPGKNLRVLAILGSVSFSIAGFIGSANELSVFTNSGTTVEQKVQALIDGRLRPSSSTASQALVLSDCMDALLAVSAPPFTSEQKSAVNRGCQTLAADITQQEPTHSLAWYLIAWTSANDGNWDAMNHALVQSQASAPNQEWNAYIRARLAFFHRQHLGTRAQSALMSDIAVAAVSQRGADWIADSFVHTPEAQTMLIEALERTPPNVQRRFVSVMKSRG